MPEIKGKRIIQIVETGYYPQEKVGNLTVGKQQMVEIALSMDAKITVSRPTTAALIESEINELFAPLMITLKVGIHLYF